MGECTECGGPVNPPYTKCYKCNMKSKGQAPKPFVKKAFAPKLAYSKPATQGQAPVGGKQKWSTMYTSIKNETTGEYDKYKIFVNFAIPSFDDFKARKAIVFMKKREDTQGKEVDEVEGTVSEEPEYE